MRAFLAPFLLLILTAASPADMARWKAQAERVTIVRDDWGIAHVSGRTDADAVFGMIYAQAEDDFPRIEGNYLTALGRMAEAKGEDAIWQDLRARLYVSEEKLKADYARSPEWLKRLMDAWADGLNYFLAIHPEVRPQVLTRFEPWMALSFTEGSIGGDIEQIDLAELRKFYSAWGKQDSRNERPVELERQNSNGIAIAPRLTANGGTLLLINPHTSFFFRSELQVTSGEGLNAYGAATWGQFFIYQGFNEHAGWMHTSSGVDVIDEFSLDVRTPELGPRYRFGSEWRAMEQRPVTIRYRTSDGSLGSRTFTTYHTQHGPIVRSENGRWVAFAMMDRPVEALQQSYLRTKATDLASFLEVAELKANSSNNTVFASSKGEIAYLHPQFVPRRDDRFDYSGVVDGSDPRTAWRALHALGELPSAINPTNGWVVNTNTWPYRAAGPFSPGEAAFPRYMDLFGPNYREVHALQLLEGSKGWTLEKLNSAAYDGHQPGFAALIPQLVRAYGDLQPTDARRAELRDAIRLLRGWDYRWSADSVAQTVAMFWGKTLFNMLQASPDEPTNRKYMRLGRDTTPDQKLKALSDALEWLRRDFGRWQVPWAEVNRFQRVSPAIDHPFSDSAPSYPVPFADGNFGSLAAFRSEPKNGSKRWYGYHGNSFVAVVEFGPRVRAHALSAGGESGDPTSSHFMDQAKLYASGALREVYFYPDQLKGHTERVYRPGE
jgi:acyl-homoserine-lactone acylase